MRVVAQARDLSKLERYKGAVDKEGTASHVLHRPHLDCPATAQPSVYRAAVYTQPMKVIGPYVISAAPVGAALHGHPGFASFPTPPESGPSAWNRPESGATAVDRTLPLHGVDRLTGMPVLLHRLNAFLVPVSLPDSPFLLPVSEVDVWDAQPYAVTELPPAAVPADHPGMAAPGVLRALAALHAAGLVHGGLNAGQFWQVGREVRLAGAGLPWKPGATPADDMKALAQALDTLGARPAALRGLETMEAAQGLAALDTVQSSPETAAARPRPTETADPLSTPADQATRTQESPLVVRPERRDGPPSVVPVVPPGQPSVGAPEPRRTASAEPRRRWDDRPDRQIAEQRSGEARRQTAQTGTLEQELQPASVLPIVAQPTTPPGEPTAPEAPRTYRTASDVIVIGEEAAASKEASPGVPASRSATAQSGTTTPVPELSDPESAAEPAATVQSPLAPVLIGFDDLPDLPADWRPDDAASAVAASSEPTVPDSLTASAKDEPALSLVAGGEAVQPERPPGRTTRYTPTDARPVGGRQLTETPAVAGDQAMAGGPRMQALRIGWEEDHSWRVVKSVEEPRSPLARRPLWPLAVLVLAALAGAAFWWSGHSAAPAAACCSQQFTVLGSKLPVRVTLVQAPPGSPLQPGAMIGTAPGVLKFPDAPGRYTLRFSAEGHGALTGAVTVPSSQAFSIMLK